METLDVTGEVLSAIAGIILSLALSYIPGLRDWFQALPSDTKRAIVGALLVVVTVGIFLAGCAGWIQGVGCDQDRALDLVGMLISALVANQAIYSITPGKPKPAV